MLFFENNHINIHLHYCKAIHGIINELLVIYIHAAKTQHRTTTLLKLTPAFSLRRYVFHYIKVTCFILTLLLKVINLDTQFLSSGWQVILNGLNYTRALTYPWI